MAEDILVIGAGIAGLSAALALAPEHRVTLIERDAPPPSGDTHEAFADWKRAGVGHLRHSHAFLARLRTLIKDNHPALLAALLEAGCRELKFADGVPDPMKEIYTPIPADEDLAILTSRRTTLELIIRRYVETLPGVTFVDDHFVRGPIIETNAAGERRVAGLKLTKGDGPEQEMRAGVTIDAGGRLSSMIEALRAAGAEIPEEGEDCGILYFTRHYRLLPGQSEPPRGKIPAGGDLGYLKYGVFPGDNGCFSITMAVPEIETEMRRNIVRPEIFDQICNELAGLRPWIDPARAEPVSRVFGMGDLKGHWRRFVVDGRAAALDFFAVGDSMIRTNPLYGRGCSFAAVEAFLLRDVLRETADPAARARLYDARLQTHLRPHYLNMRSQDRAAIKRAREALDPDFKPSLRARLTRSFVEDGVAIAMRSDLTLYRAAMRDFHMLTEKPGAWMRKPDVMLKILGWWARGKKANADRYAPRIGPERKALYATLGIDPAVFAPA